MTEFGMKSTWLNYTAKIINIEERISKYVNNAVFNQVKLTWYSTVIYTSGNKGLSTINLRHA